MTYRRFARLGAVLALLALVSSTGRASAQLRLVGEHITRYDVDITVQRSGRLHVVETIDYTFTTPKRGILRKLPVRVLHTREHDRLYPVSAVQVTGSPGTPTRTKLEKDGGYLVVRVGEPERTITGTHRYVIAYDLDGAFNRFGTESEGHDELYWNVIGPEWPVIIASSSVRVRAQEAFSASNCFAGQVRSSLPCRTSRVAGTDATFEHGLLAPFQAMTVVLALPKGYAREVGPILEERWTLKRAFRADATTVPLALLTLLAGAGAVLMLLNKRGRDRQYAGQVPGLEPGTGDDVATEPAPVRGDRAGPIEWSPGDMPPGLMGLLLDEEVHTLDVTATIVDLAVRGHLRIDELPREGLFRKRNWRMTRLPAPEGDALTEWESKTMQGLFGPRDVVEMDDLKNEFHVHLAGIKDALYDEALRRGWFTRRPDGVRGLWFGAAVAVTGLGAGATYLLARWTTFGLVGLALLATGLVFLAVHRRMPFRTAKGSAALARALGFRRYLATAEAEQLRAEEKANVFARYLPYAVVLGETERWAKVFAALGLPPQQHMSWYSGPAGWSYHDFNDSMSAFSSSTSSTIASTPGSSGSSGFGGGGGGGGHAGGGGGGGGGSSW